MRDFLKYTFASLLALLIFLGMSISGLLFLVILAASRDPVPRVKEKSVLTFNMALDVTDGLRSDVSSFGQALGSDSSIPLKAALDAINQAAKDQRIVALYLHGRMSGSTGYATLKEIREALQRFRATGKKVVAYDLDWGEREYYLTSVADSIVLHPFGSLELNGLNSEGTFFAGALQKYGIGVQVTRVGKYKSAVEPFLLTKRSPENRQQTQQLLGDLWDEFSTSVNQERKVTPQQLQSIADSDGLLEPTEALNRRLITKVGYEDEVVEQLKQLSTEDNNSFRRINLQTYAKVARSTVEKERGGKNKIALVYAEGDIVDGKGDSDQIGGDRFAKLLREIRQDDDIKAVVLRVNSPGGSAVASEVIQREVILTRKQKPVVVSMGSVAASGGYWISTYSDRIFAEPNTITGSIGVFGLLPNVQELANRNGVTWDAVKTGRYADIQTITRPKTAQELALIQKSVDRIYDQFITKVADSRKLPKAKVAEIAQGRVWSGKQAKALGLVDELGGLEAALQEAAKRAKLGERWQIEEYPEPPSFAEVLFGNSDNQIAKYLQGDDVVLQELRKIQADLAILNVLNDPRGVYVRLPMNLRID
ncbi:MAG: signal peptide peptidase SppA [Oscillatoriales cyanobacterium C42_A2020_001]|nr:signal peptide peptidase SppA [Leptolyngbyaceae cyanobacterium C42_A2020_001]